MLESTRRAVESLPPGVDARQRLEAAIEGHLRGIQRDLPYTTTNARFQGHVSATGRKQLQPLRSAYTCYWRDLLADARSEGLLDPQLDLSLVRALLLGSLNRTVAWFHLEQGPIESLIHMTIVAIGGIWAQPRPSARKPFPPSRRVGAHGRKKRPPQAFE